MLKMVDSYKKYKKHGAKIILMPKAFGPINKEGTIALAKGLFSVADVIYARDKFSLSELEKHGIKGDKIKLCPDYSSVVKPKKDSNQEKYKGMVCLIPNFRFIDKSNITSDYYVNSFVKIINNLRERGLESYFVIHSMIYDVDIAHRVNNLLDIKVDIIEEPDPKKLKGYIGQALFSVSSRYHGIMNSLSQNVPSIGTSWNHKYVELYKEYGIIDLLVTEFSYEEILSKIDYLLSDNEINIASNSIKNRNITVHEVVENMWSNVFEIIDK
jgi:colanic acid/amylovoran biosynthesis protein